ncbi:protoporphyrinogen oxidase [Methanolinea mesophila]|uniref:NAD(P)/FAD-dependent oxidoreductase n=1 Tax=Methanolinea mesophila TaxID=547055 RepID=UPI001AE8B7E0|nr:NAD(P)/FAD-dependent oxidoreductase [Methanolinea mesophila]MBP1928419.1 protoporphyrinogen oxidase [Methanolinea mesophila]
MKICIIGGGLTGLAAAFRLAGSHEVDLVEKRDHLGGCLASYDRERYWIEKFYHHCFVGDDALLALIRELGIEDRLEWLKGTSGYYVEGKVYPLNTPLEIARYPFLTLGEKYRLAMLTLRAKKLDVDALDGVRARDYVLDNLGEGIYRSFFEPLLRSKFGERSGDVSAAWLISRIAIRSHRGLSGERLGYLNGGFQVLVDALGDWIGKHATFRLNDPVTVMGRTGDGWMVNGRHYDRVVSTIPPQELARISGIPLAPVPYQGAACMTLAIDRDVTDGVYWLNMRDPAPYGAVVSHTNFAPVDRYGERLVYLASYFTGELPPRHDRVMREDFCKRFGVREEEIRWQHMAVEPYAGPLYTTGYRERLPDYAQDGLFIAGMFSRPNYPERSMEGSVRAGYEAAELAGRM